MTTTIADGEIQSPIPPGSEPESAAAEPTEPRGRPRPPRKAPAPPPPEPVMSLGFAPPSIMEDDESPMLGRASFPPMGRMPSNESEPAQPLTPQRRKEVEQGLEDVLSDFDFSSSEFKVVLIRDKPTYHKGIEIGGWLGQFEKPLPTEEVKATYGGGSYRWQIHGPNPKMGGRQGLLKNVGFKISGDPIVQSSGQSDDTGGPTPLLVKSIIDAKDRDVVRVTRELEESRKMLMSQRSEGGNGLKEVVSVLAQMNNPAAARDMLNEERTRTEQRLRDEREERKREADASERRYAEQMRLTENRHREMVEQAKHQHEREMKEIQLRAEADRQAAKEAATQKSQSADTMMVLMQKMQQDQLTMLQATNAAQEKRTQDAQLFMAQMQQQQSTALMEQMKQVEAMKSDFLNKQLERLTNKKDDLSEMMEKVMAFRSMFDDLSGRSDTRDTWEKVADTVKEAAPGLLAMVSAARSQPASSAPKIAPGSVAVVDLGPGPARFPPKRKVVRTRPKGFAEGLAGRDPVADAAPVIVQPEWVPEIAAPETEMEQAVKMLIQNIEKALSLEWETKQVYDNIVSKYPKPVLTMFKEAGSDKCIEVIGQLSPADWIVNTLRGKKLIAELVNVLATTA